MKSALFIVVVGAYCASIQTADAAPARFWISSSATDPFASSNISMPQGATRSLHIWAQPETINNGLFGGSNGFRTLSSFSLDVISGAANIDFTDGTYIVYNPNINGVSRYQYTLDSISTTGCAAPDVCLSSSATATQVLAPTDPPTTDRIGGKKSISSSHDPGLQGFAISTTSVSGIGPSCIPSDSFCVTTNNVPAWLVASVQLQNLRSTGTTPIFLQVGSNGMLHLGDQDTSGTDVVFDSNPAVEAPLYNAGNLNQRAVHLSGDAPDAIITAAAPLPGDFNRDGSVGQPDYQLWRTSVGQLVTPGTGSDGNGNGVIDAADYVFWRNNVTLGATLGNQSAATVNVNVPEAASFTLAISGLAALLCRRRFLASSRNA